MIIGILVYGSIIDDPGCEIAGAKIDVIDCTTPFKVEIARSIRTRNGALTLIPFNDGSQVKAKIFVLHDGITETEAQNLLYRRETGNICNTEKTYHLPPDATIDSVFIERISNYCDIDIIFYTRIGQNIADLSPTKLAKLAIKSAKSLSGSHGRDGISYFMSLKRNGIVTPVMPRYEYEILRLTNTSTLFEALQLGIHK